MAVCVKCEVFYKLLFGRSRLTVLFKRFSKSSRMSSNVLVEKIDNITLIGLNRPEKRNAVNNEMSQELITAVESFEEDTDSPVGVLYGNGGNFCAGYDLSEIAKYEDSRLEEILPNFENSGNGPMGPSRRMIRKPLIAAVTGYAVAGGLELALLCDLRVVEETAIMGVFCRRFGVPLIDGGTVRLPHLIGLSRALDLILTGRPVTAKEAYDMGLANRVVCTGAALGQAIQMARNVAKFPQVCLNKDRTSAYQSTEIQAAMDFEFTNSKELVCKGARNFVDGIGRGGNFNTYRSKTR